MVFAKSSFCQGVEFNLVDKNSREILLYVTNATDLGAFEIELSFSEPATKETPEYCIGKIQSGQLLKKCLRTFQLLGPRYQSDGKAIIAFYSFGDGHGVAGNGVAARIKFRCDSSSIRISGVKATNTRGEILRSKF